MEDYEAIAQDHLVGLTERMTDTCLDELYLFINVLFVNMFFGVKACNHV